MVSIEVESATHGMSALLEVPDPRALGTKALISPKRILVVDDEPNIRLTVAQMLRVSGYEVAEAATGDDAVALSRQSEFDLILSDIRMPGMNGCETFRALRALQPGVRGVAMTGFADDSSEGAALGAGFDHLIRKPFTFKTLLQAVEAALGPHPGTSD